MWASGRADTVLRWMEWFETEGLVERYPAIAVHGALMYALMGRPADTERWAVAAERARASGTLPDGNTVEGMVAYLRALLCRNGVDEMRRDAQIAGRARPASPYRATMLHTEGLAYLLDGDARPGRRDLRPRRRRGDRAGCCRSSPPLLAERGIVAIERDDWPGAEAFAEPAHVDHAGRRASTSTGRARSSTRGWPVSRCTAATSRGRGLRRRAARLRPLLTYALPVVSVQALLEMARAYVALADPAGGRAVLRQVTTSSSSAPSSACCPPRPTSCGCSSTRSGERPGASSLTTAELRLLPLLPTHLSFREIGERLYVSRHTVKTQAISIYRKLGVSSRSEAITRMHELGLLTRDQSRRSSFDSSARSMS